MGVQEYWLIDPASETIAVYRRDTSGFGPPIRFGRVDVLTTPLLPGLEVPVDRILL